MTYDVKPVGPGRWRISCPMLWGAPRVRDIEAPDEPTAIDRFESQWDAERRPPPSKEGTGGTREGGERP